MNGYLWYNSVGFQVFPDWNLKGSIYPVYTGYIPKPKLISDFQFVLMACWPAALHRRVEDDWAQKQQLIQFMANLPILTGAEAGGSPRWEEGAPPLKLQISAACACRHRGLSLQRADRRWVQRRRQGGGPGIAGPARAGVKLSLVQVHGASSAPPSARLPHHAPSSARQKIRPMDVSK